MKGADERRVRGGLLHCHGLAVPRRGYAEDKSAPSWELRDKAHFGPFDGGDGEFAADGWILFQK